MAKLYFPHDLDSQKDERLTILLKHCGLAGIGAYWILIEHLHSNEKGVLSEEGFNATIDQYGSSGDAALAKQMLSKIKEWIKRTGLVKEKDGVVYSDRVFENLKKQKELKAKRSEAGAAGAKARQNGSGSSKSKDQANAKQMLSKSQASAKHVLSSVQAIEVNRIEVTKDIHTTAGVFDFESLYKDYPRPERREEAEKYFYGSVVTEEDFRACNRALANYKAHLKETATKFQYIKTAGAFFKDWRAWVNPHHRRSHGAEPSALDRLLERSDREEHPKSDVDKMP